MVQLVLVHVDLVHVDTQVLGFTYFYTHTHMPLLFPASFFLQLNMTK
jgi:hypothetical protein